MSREAAGRRKEGVCRDPPGKLSEDVGGLRCVDGSYLTVTPRACVDSRGVPYEVTLELYRNGTPYGVVGERCGWFLARLAEAVARSRAAEDGAAARWPDPDDRFPEDCSGTELFAFRYRARTAVVGGGELRCQVRTLPLWVPAGDVSRDEHGRGVPVGEWRVIRRAVVEAWGTTGNGLRALLTSGELAEFVSGLVAEAEDLLGGAIPGDVQQRVSGRFPGAVDRRPVGNGSEWISS